MKKVSRYAKLDPAHILDGLFVPRVQKGQALYDVEGEFDGGTIGFKGVQLGIEHQSVLLAVAARTGQQKMADGLLVHGSENDLLARQFSLLEPTGEIEKYDISKVECTAYALLTDAGLGDGGNQFKHLLSLLHEMSTVTMYREKDNKGGISRLLGFQRDGDKLVVSLNWRMAHAIFGGQNIQVSLHERHCLTGAAKILHTWLSAHIRLGGQLMAGRGASIDSLIAHVWGKRPSNENQHRKRRVLVRSALNEIGKLEGWVVRLEGSTALVSRPKELPFTARGKTMLPGDIAVALAYDPSDPDNDLPPDA